VGAELQQAVVEAVQEDRARRRQDHRQHEAREELLALLQLAKSQRVRLSQDVDLTDIRVEIVPESERPEEAPTVPDVAAVASAAAPRAEAKKGEGAYGYSVVDDFNDVPIPLSERAEAKDPQAPPPAPAVEDAPPPAP